MSFDRGIFPRRLYRTLRETPKQQLLEVMLSFGFRPEETHVGTRLQSSANNMLEDEFVHAVLYRLPSCAMSDYERMLLQLAARAYDGVVNFSEEQEEGHPKHQT